MTTEHLYAMRLKSLTFIPKASNKPFNQSQKIIYLKKEISYLCLIFSWSAKEMLMSRE